MRARGFTLVEVMIVVLIIGILMSIAVPQFLQAREQARYKTCLSNLHKINEAKEMRAMDLKMVDGDACTMADISPAYIRMTPVCPAGGGYTSQVIGTPPTCSFVSVQYPHVMN